VAIIEESQDSVAHRAIMFADVSGSSSLYKRYGNVAAKAHIDRALHLMRDLTESHGGRVVKTIGDEVMARFDQPEDACRAACAIQHQCHRSNQADIDGEDVAIRIGMDFGHTLLDGDDVFGDTVNDAAYVAQIARPNQIVVTQALVDALPAVLRASCEEFDRVNIKGETSKSLIFRLLWESPSEDQSATTVMAVHNITQQISTRQLQLDYHDQLFAITSDDVPFIIGRDHRKAHLHVDSSLASRDHCHIVLRRGKFVLADHSTNGTYVKVPKQPEIYLRREELPLVGEGSISLGKPAGSEPQLTIHYKL